MVRVMSSVVCLFRGGVPCDHYSWCIGPQQQGNPPSPDIVKLVQLGPQCTGTLPSSCEASIVSKLAVGIILEWFHVSQYFSLWPIYKKKKQETQGKCIACMYVVKKLSRRKKVKYVFWKNILKRLYRNFPSVFFRSSLNPKFELDQIDWKPNKSKEFKR